MTNEQTIALLLGVLQAVRRAKYDVNNAPHEPPENADLPVTTVWGYMERLERDIGEQIDAVCARWNKS